MANLVIPPNDRLKSAEMLGTILVLHWHDGHRSELPLATLRDSCPCAACLGARGKKARTLTVLGPASPADVDAIQAVGRYALQFHWRDGHATGIYSFNLLRGLCECPDCSPE